MINEGLFEGEHLNNDVVTARCGFQENYAAIIFFVSVIKRSEYFKEFANGSNSPISESEQLLFKNNRRMANVQYI